MKKTDITLLKNLLSYDEKNLMTFCHLVLKEKYGEHNVYQTPDFCYAMGDIPVLMVAHLDTVLSSKPVIMVTNDYSTWMGRQGLGADDRAGVYAIIKLLRWGYKPSVLFTTGEEIGGLGAESFVCQFPEAPVPTKYVIEIDRRGRGQAVYYNCGNKKFESYVTSFGFKTHKGIFSDISFICPYWDVAGVNLSAGYYNEHTHYESLKIEDLNFTIENVKKMLDNAEEAELFSFENTRKDKHLMYSKCDVCEKIVPYFSIIPVEGVKTCFDCFNNFGTWCESCQKPFFFKEPFESTKCEVCTNGQK